MSFELPKLPYAMDALQPHLSKETLEFHYGKHHNAYVTNLNKLTEGTKFATMSLDEVVLRSDGAIFNNAAQVWNHTFYWNCLSPKGGGQPKSALTNLLTKNFGSVDEFKAKFTQSATTLFGSGWAWLVKKSDGTLAIEQTSNAGNPVTSDKKPLLTCDVWEHAYYIDYRNLRPKYVESFWNLINWDYVEAQL